MCAEAYGQEMSVSRRHINSAFMTFVVLDQQGQPRTLPMVAPEPGVSTIPSLVARGEIPLGPQGLSDSRQNKWSFVVVGMKLLNSKWIELIARCN